MQVKERVGKHSEPEADLRLGANVNGREESILVETE